MALGGWAISEELYGWLERNVPPGQTVVELGSGQGTADLCKRWKVWSVEHDPTWAGSVKQANYVLAPLRGGWYDRAAVKMGLSGVSYSALVIDGPPGTAGRLRFADNADLFDPAAHWVFDDLQRHDVKRSAARLAHARGKKLGCMVCSDGREFGVIKGDG
jgi:hypothetical protein